MREVADVVLEFREGRLGSYVRGLRLSGLTAARVHGLLTTTGFLHALRPVIAERSNRGAPRYLRLDGGSTMAVDDPSLLLVHEYVHPDAGLVRVYASGDPRGREVPDDGPYAVKAVLFPGSPARKGEASTFYDLAFRVAEDGKVVSKSRRQVYGVAYDPDEPLASWVFAEVHLGEVAYIPLRKEGA